VRLAISSQPKSVTLPIVLDRWPFETSAKRERRCTGEGPRFVRLGHKTVSYRVEVLMLS